VSVALRTEASTADLPRIVSGRAVTAATSTADRTVSDAYDGYGRTVWHGSRRVGW
jgi:hypothetical protein